jgi:nitronate monooxygenase
LNDDVTTMLLTPRIVESVDLPVVTVGGIADGRTMAAALALGAQGVMMASRFIATQECVCHDAVKQELVRRQENDTTLFGQSIGLQGRALMNQVIGEVIEIEKRGGGLEELIPLISGERIKQAWETGNLEMAPLMVGQSIGLIRDVPTCRELLESMARECAETLERAGRMAGLGSDS